MSDRLTNNEQKRALLKSKKKEIFLAYLADPGNEILPRYRLATEFSNIAREPGCIGFSAHPNFPKSNARPSTCAGSGMLPTWRELTEAFSTGHLRRSGSGEIVFHALRGLDTWREAPG